MSVSKVSLSIRVRVGEQVALSLNLPTLARPIERVNLESTQNRCTAVDLSLLCYTSTVPVALAGDHLLYNL